MADFREIKRVWRQLAQEGEEPQGITVEPRGFGVHYRSPDGSFGVRLCLEGRGDSGPKQKEGDK